MCKVYIIGIAGRTMASLAKMLADMGWEVTGSDQNAYPPVTTFLEEQGIDYELGYEAEHISENLDLVIVGGNAMHVVNPNPELERARELGIKVQSYPEVFHDLLEKEESIVVAGTYGKTTICALLAWIMEVGGLNPSFDIGELPSNFDAGTRNTSSKYSIIHGDEHPTLGYSDLPKFAYFNPKYVILTAAMWDHFNIYDTEESYVRVFKELVGKIPEEGWILVSDKGENNGAVAELAKCKFYRYGISGEGRSSSPTFEGGVRGGHHLIFKYSLNGEEFEVELPEGFFGRHNMENAVGAIAAARLLGVAVEKIQEAMRTFKGLKRHLELVGRIPPLLKGRLGGVTAENIIIYRDQGQHPQKARGAVEALRERYPDRRLIAILDPYASVLHDKESLQWYDHAFAAADEVIIGGMKIRKLKKGESKHDRVTGRRIRNAIQKTQKHVCYLPMNSQIVKYLRENLQGGEVLLFLSTRDFGGLIEEVIEAHK